MKSELLLTLTVPPNDCASRVLKSLGSHADLWMINVGSSAPCSRSQRLPMLCQTARLRGTQLRSRAFRSSRAYLKLVSQTLASFQVLSCQPSRHKLQSCSLWSHYRRSFSCTRVLAVSAPSKSLLDGYDAQQIQVLEGLQPVRKRPGMYIGSTGEKGLHHLIWEVVDNCIDEVQGAHAKEVKIEVDLGSGWVEVSDDGRGIPVDIHPATGKSALETVLTVLHAGGKFGGADSGYQVSGGLHGVGISVVNALSECMEVTVRRQGMRYFQKFAEGTVVSKLQAEELPRAERKQTGTSIRFLYDKKIFSKGLQFNPETIELRLRELAYLNSAATVSFRALSAAASEAPDWTQFHFKGGIKEYVAWVNREKPIMHDPIFVSKKVDGVIVEIALQWCNLYTENLISFVNNVKTVDGGTHVEGFKTALTRVFNAQARKSKVLKDSDSNLSGDHVRNGLSVIISVKVPNPEFEGQTKAKLGNPEVRRIVDNIVTTELADAFENDTSTFNTVAQKALQAFQAAEAAKKARDLVRRKNAIVRSTLPGKLADCSATDLQSTEIFLVEGDSAGGSAKQARDRKFQAILPLRGKILNVEKIDQNRLYDNKEVNDMIIALGLRIQEQAGKLRYGKIILLTDADVDGAHIRTLLLTFFFRHQPELFEKGYIYVGVPPLYKVEVGRKSEYCYSEEDKDKAIKALGGRGQKLHIQRFKGLGEMMPEQLWQTTLNPETRALRRLTISDMEAAHKTFDELMGDRVPPRKQLITEHGSKIALDDLDF